MDLAEAHVLGVKHLLDGGKSQIFNLSNGSGFSVKEVIEMAKTVTGCTIPVIEKQRRPGDPPVLVGSSEKAWRMLGWRSKHPELTDIITDAWNWHQKRHRSFPSSQSLSIRTDQSEVPQSVSRAINL